MTAKFGGMKVVTLQGVIVVCYGCGKGDDQVDMVSLLGASTGCQRNNDQLWVDVVPLLGAITRMTTNIGRVDVVPLLGAIAGIKRFQA